MDLERSLRARYADKPGVIRSNVAARVCKPSLRLIDSETGEATEERRVTEQDILTAGDFARVIQQVPEPCRLLVRLTFLTVVRQAELLGLQWSDLDRAKESL